MAAAVSDARVVAVWRPTSETDLRSALDADLLRETHLVELKATTGSTRGERSETARDLASLALDGGQLIVGIKENKPEKRYELAPVELDGRIEALEEIAEHRVEPPLTIHAYEIPSDTDPLLGYLIVNVDASPVAPHMVDGTYFGRGEKRRRQLGDAEVLRLHRARDEQVAGVQAALATFMAESPLPEVTGQQGHLYLIALPSTAPPGAAVTAVWDSDWVRNTSARVENSLPRDLAQYPPTARYGSVVTGSHGLSVSTIDERFDPNSPVSDRTVLQIDLQEDGAVRLLNGRLTDTDTRNGVAIRVILDGVLVANAYRLLAWAVAVADASGYRGAWDLALTGTQLAGCQALTASRDINRFGAPQYPAHDFAGFERATNSEIREDPAAVVGRLTGRLLRALDVAGDWPLLFPTK